DLFLFTNIKEIILILCRYSLVNSSNLTIYQTIIDILLVVKYLISHFRDCFTIKKIINR
ncbi:hypothetical protein EDB80DRAFT_531662, partial [Ilyonectria destructans]